MFMSIFLIQHLFHPISDFLFLSWHCDPNYSLQSFLIFSYFFVHFRSLRVPYFWLAAYSMRFFALSAITFILNLNKLMLSFIQTCRFYCLLTFDLVLVQILFYWSINSSLIILSSTANHSILLFSP